ncbi:TPA: hypothetical protein ACVU43_004876 [Vibrio parahaemolyticus]|nr:hypothetical protein [Vibrio parahaemolyticus]
MTDNELKLLVALLKSVDEYGLKTFISLKEKVEMTEKMDFNFLEKISKEKSNRLKQNCDYIIAAEKYLDNIEINKKLAVNELIDSFKSQSKIKDLSDASNYLDNLGFSDKKISTWEEGVLILIKGLSKYNFNLEYVTQIKNDLG